MDTEPARPTFTVGPLSFAIELARLIVWLQGARDGDQLVYGHGPVRPNATPVVKEIDALVADQILRTHQRRVDGRVEYFVVKRTPAVDPVPVRVPPPRFGDEIDARVLRILCRAANAGAVCPSNAELARECGLPDPDAASYRFRKLIQSGAIRSEEQGPTKRRLVTIVATGQRTVAGPL